MPTSRLDTRRGTDLSSIAALGLLVLTLATLAFHSAWTRVVAAHRLPDWDGASHALKGAQMADALRQLHLGKFLALIHNSTPWPPLYHVFEAPFFIAFGNHYRVAAAIAPFELFGCIVAAFLVGVASGGPRGLVMGAVAAALMSASTFFQVFGGLVMLELPGTLLMLLALLFYVRYRRHDRLGDARVTCVLTLLLFMLKYNYGLMLIMPLVLNEIGHAAPSWATLRSTVRRGLIERRWITPFVMFVAAYLVAAVLLASHRGQTLSLGSVSFVAPGLSRPLLLLLVIVAVRFALRPRAHAQAVRAWLAGLHPAARAFVLIVVAPSAAWLIVPTHMKWFLEFVSNRTSHVPLLSAANLTYYPVRFVLDYSPMKMVGIVALALGVATIVLIPRLRADVRIIPVALAVGLFMTTAHRFKLSRFFFLVAPLVWLCCGIAVAAVLDAATRRLDPRLRAVLAPVIAVIVVVLAGAFGRDTTGVERVYRRMTTNESVARVIDSIADVGVASNGVLVMGTWDLLSPALIEWYEVEARAGRPPHGLLKNPGWYKNLAPGPLLDTVAADGEVERIAVLSLEPGDAAYTSAFDQINGWLPAVQTAIATDPRFKLEWVQAFDDSGYELRIYRKVG